LAGGANAVTMVNWAPDAGLRANWVRFDARGEPAGRAAWQDDRTVRGYGLSRDGAKLITVYDDGLRVRAAPHFEAPASIPLPGAEPGASAALPPPRGRSPARAPATAYVTDDGKRLVTLVNRGKGVGIWDLAHGTPPIVAPLGAETLLGVSPDGHTVVVGATVAFEGSPARVIDGRTGERVTTLRPSASFVFFTVPFAPASDRFAIAEAFAGTRLYSRSGALLQTLIGPGGEAEGPAAFSPGGEYLAFVDSSLNLQIWSVADGRHVAAIASSVRDPWQITWVGSRVAVLRADGMLTLYPCEVCRSTGALLDLARSRRARELTPGERRQYLHEG
jgi:WD40 repeat protein